MSDITDRLKELAHAAADQNWGEFSMRVPADHARDADLVLLAASKEITSLRAELERERMRLAACGVVAMANTPESAARARDIHPDYRSASCDDVARAVDSEMSLRAELATADAFHKVAVKERDYERTVVDGLRAELAEVLAANTDMQNAFSKEALHVDSLQAELAEARKPDCRTCMWYGPISEGCNRAGGSIKCAGVWPTSTIPVRLYEREEK